MREVLFRGKQIDNGEWVEGYYVCLYDTKGHKTHRIYTGYAETDCGDYYPEWFEVDPETVGQYTGLKDKNGKRIFEGDVVAQNWYDYNAPLDDSFGEVVFCEYNCSFSVMDIENGGIVPLGNCHAYHWEAEVIGNIHDNPELLEVNNG